MTYPDDRDVVDLARLSEASDIPPAGHAHIPPGPSGARPPTIREVATAAGVSPMTVSRVLTGRGYVADKTAERVRVAFERMGYRPNPVARMLRSQRSHLIGVTIPSLASSVHRDVVSGVEEVFETTGYQLILGHLQSGLHPSSDFVKVARAQHCDGYVIVPSRADAGRAVAGPLDRPAVVALSSILGQDGDAVLTDGRDAAREAAAYLLERFGAPVAYVGLDSRLSHDLSLLAGYREAMEIAGCEPWELSVRSGEQGAHQGVRAMLASPQRPRAFLFGSSILHLEGLGALVQSRLTIGEDVGVVAIASDERSWTALLPAPLPLMVIPAREIGRRAARQLLRRFADPGAEVVQEVVPMELLLPAGSR